ncbi:tol-pal system-associated acyl-CoA thioesterase [Sulfuriflexus sp.]|uniref:tol-pal system-associated acyl-CoA thioesterase n=1 Tax=Sulfuriflexus sp. TaxID=2015443 RepID=UPI0028CFA4DE|nr:tol-pal system-associated acyl-CoA thioesterase [Sulfuriflexus sp.]MDT8404258.1 tol-pal system-associated acyl-CoA thioesterase [Sulfuriflexus sp.]
MTDFLWLIRVYYEDTDSGGVVYYANYLKFMERARTEMLRHKGFEQDRLREEDQLLFVVRAVEMDLLQPARFNDRLRVKTRIADSTRTSLTFAQTIYRDGEEKPLCSGRIRVACIDAQRWKPVAIPQQIIQELMA